MLSDMPTLTANEDPAWLPSPEPVLTPGCLPPAEPRGCTNYLPVAAWPNPLGVAPGASQDGAGGTHSLAGSEPET